MCLSMLTLSCSHTNKGPVWWAALLRLSKPELPVEAGALVVCRSTNLGAGELLGESEGVLLSVTHEKFRSQAREETSLHPHPVSSLLSGAAAASQVVEPPEEELLRKWERVSRRTFIIAAKTTHCLDSQHELVAKN